jgi:hypothetical protein
VAQLIATGGGGGGLPSTGGTMTGNLNMQMPFKVVQCEPPVGPCDLTNKAYVDSLIGGGPFLPLTGGTMTGEILQPLAPSTGNSLANKTYVDAQGTGATIPDATTYADTNFNQSLTLAIGGLNAPSLAIYCNVYYKNNGGP